MPILQSDKKFVELLGKVPNVAVKGYNKDRVIIYWNKASEIMFGYTEEEAIGQKFDDLIIHDNMKNDVINLHNNWHNNGIEIPSGELPLKHKNGSTIFVYSSHVMLGEGTNNPEMFCMDIDLTKSKIQEEELQERTKQLYSQSKMAAMGDMIGNIAHQWRQPLSVISTAATGMLAEKEYGLLSEEKFTKSCNAINNNAQYLSKTIDDFRNFIKGDRTKRIFSLTNDINSFLHLIEGSIKNHNIDIIQKIQEDIQIDGYENELTQCFINIFNNAKDALNENVTSNENKLIFIKTSKIENKAIIKIKDNGGGIPINILPNIFEPYFTTKHKSQGTGLGLSMTYSLIVDGMKGTIEANNVKYEYNKNNYMGTEFTITIPLS